MTKFDQFFAFFKQKFDLLLVAGLFTYVFFIYVWNTSLDAARLDKLDMLWNGLLYAFLALLGVRGGLQPTASVGPTSTESGDVVIQQMPGPAESGQAKDKDKDKEEEKKYEKP